MSSLKVIHEGATYELLPQGLLIFITGFFFLIGSSVLMLILALIFAIIGIGVMAASTGIEVDTENKQLRKYQSILWIKRGKWISLSDFVEIKLIYNTNHTNDAKIKRSLLYHQPTTAKTYDLIGVDDIEEETVINPFTKISLASKTCKALEEIEGIKITNHVQNWLNQQRKYRRNG